MDGSDDDAGGAESALHAALIDLAADPDRNLERWARLKTAASRLIVDLGGTISHQHGVGSDHADYLSNEKGTLGMKFLREASRFFDPDGIMNPAVLLDATQRVPEISENEHSNR